MTAKWAPSALPAHMWVGTINIKVGGVNNLCETRKRIYHLLTALQILFKSLSYMLKLDVTRLSSRSSDAVSSLTFDIP